MSSSSNIKPQNGSYQNHSSSGCSSASSSVDLKFSISKGDQKRQKQQNNAAAGHQKQQPHFSSSHSNTGRSRSFLHCLGKHLGRHFPQHQIHQLRNERNSVVGSSGGGGGVSVRASNMMPIYNSEEDIHSSSTDSFSLSYERYATHTSTTQAQSQPHHHEMNSGHHHNTHMNLNGSSADITGEERSSGTSSAASAYSRLSSNPTNVFNAEIDEIWLKRHERHHYYLDTSNMSYRRPVSALGHNAGDITPDDDDDNDDDYSYNSQGDDRDADNDNDSDDDNNRTSLTKKTTAVEAVAVTGTTKSKISKQRRSSICFAGTTTAATDSVIRIAPKKNSSAPNVELTTITTAAAMTMKTPLKNKTKKSGSLKPITTTITPPPSRSRSTSPCSITKGLHLSRLSIASSVCRMFQHFNINSSSSTATTTTASSRSLSCSSTPLRGMQHHRNESKKSSTANSNNNLNNNNQCRNTRSNSKKRQTSTSHTFNSSSSSSSARSSSFSILNTNSNTSQSKKKEKKQQSILRPPVSYVYMKGMSGLYSRVPRYTVCCPYQGA